ncbi:MAG: hypothetical protein H0X13_15590 [Ramlibacter sp.]|nr:hypothetical protein [Ramlibacter sp.]
MSDTPTPKLPPLPAAMEKAREVTLERLMALVLEYGRHRCDVDRSNTAKGQGRVTFALERIREAAHALASLPPQPAAQPVQQEALDAKRYRWWRLYAVQDEDCSYDDAFLNCETPEDLDALTDTAIAKAEGSKP